MDQKKNQVSSRIVRGARDTRLTRKRHDMPPSGTESREKGRGDQGEPGGEHLESRCGS